MPCPVERVVRTGRLTTCKPGLLFQVMKDRAVFSRCRAGDGPRPRKQRAARLARQSPLDALLDLTVRRVAEGLEAELAKVLEYMPAEKRLLMRAGVGFARTCGCSAQLRAIHAAPRCRRMTPRTYECLRGYPKGKEGCGMTDKTTIEINVDTFTDRDSYFVRTEVEARSVSIYGPFPDPQTAQKLKADQLASRANVSEGLKEKIQQVMSTLPAAGA
jgi:hypothetical protein